ncbi:hypothetical protein FFWV33_02980 [Flavobacterium faecale]|uniref:Urease accessory protein UreD n=1 Tax=Flavobacterium faecale TaxID=1355330 RepID=A0A2S1LA64_9FLAO|nr:urease accessory protein UreD [Flavobacterium faecale]AWG20568.1 hypothetical protein FFWV33_02980 [Flavobacterium faecale]
MISKVTIESVEKRGITELKSVFCLTPFKVVEVREDKKNPLLELMLMSSSPGVLDNDELSFDYLIAENCQVEMTTQSFQRLFTMENSAVQKTNVVVKENAFLSYLPQPTVPHKDSNFKSVNTIHLEKNAAVVWGEIFTCGRKLKDEIFQFTQFQSLTKIIQEEKLVYFENLFLNPTKRNPLNIGQYEGFTHQLSLVYIDDACDIPDLKKQLDSFLEDKQCTFGISETATNGLSIKILDFKAEKLLTLMKQLTQIIKNGRL